MGAPEFRWVVPVDHPAFAGHFPGRPIVPGVVLLDQAIRFAERHLGLADVAWQVGNAKFLSPVGPGETLVFSLTVKANGGIAFTVRALGGEGSDNTVGRDVASGSLTPPAPC